MVSDLKPMKEGIFKVGPPPKLLGALCATCNEKYFPVPMACPHCMGELQEVELSAEGTVYTFATLRIKPLWNLPSPYAVGWVNLEADGIKVFSLFDPANLNELGIGKRVSLRVGEMGVGTDNEPCLRYYFTPENGSDER